MLQNKQTGLRLKKIEKRIREIRDFCRNGISLSEEETKERPLLYRHIQRGYHDNFTRSKEDN